MENTQIVTLVLLKEENLPPYKSALPRIIEVMPGQNGKIRTYKLKTDFSIFLRSISKLLLLFIKGDET